MKKKSNHKKDQIIKIIIIFLLVALLLITLYFAVLKNLLLSFEAEDYCSAKGEKLSKQGIIWGPQENQECMELYKNHNTK